jgi:Protein of unknown function (DUF3313)
LDTSRFPILIVAALAGGLLASCQTIPPYVAPDAAKEGLEPIDIPGLDAAFARPGASLAPYKSILLDPVEVAFSKEWKPDMPGSYLPMSDADREKVRKDLADLSTQTFTEALKKGGYPVVTEPGPDVLRIVPRLEDVYINAPDVNTPGRTSQYVKSAGRMTLVAELRDSASGEILARVYDQREGRTNEALRLSSSVSNYEEVRDMVTRWANIFLGRLNKAQVEPSSTP